MIYFQQIVVEEREWVPELNLPLTSDNVTGTRLNSFFARIPSSASEDDGLLLRLYSSNNPGRNMYFIKILKSREVMIGKSNRDASDEPIDNIQVTNTSSTIRWLEKRDYTGFWVVFNFGYKKNY